MRYRANSYPDPAGEKLLNWMILISFGLHIVLFLVLLLTPGFNSGSRTIAPVYTVDLVSIAALSGGGAPAVKPAPQPKEIKTIVPLRQAEKIRISAPPETVDAKTKEEVVEELPVLTPEPVVKVKMAAAPKIPSIDSALKKIEKKKVVEKAKIEETRKEQLRRAREDALKAEEEARRQRAEQARIAQEEAQRKRVREQAARRAAAARAEKERRERANLQQALSSVEASVRETQEESLNQALQEVAEGHAGGGVAGEDLGDAGGGAPVGLRLQIYKTNIWNKVRNNWSYPEIFGRGNSPEALVRLRVRNDGSIVRFGLVKKSGNPVFDQSVLRAVQLSDPLPPFPEGYVKSYEEIELRFSLSDLATG